MSYNELLNNIKPYVKNVKSNIEESKSIEENLKNVERDIKEYEGLGELGKSELAKANNKKSSLEANKKKLENKSKNELDIAKKLIKNERRMYESKVKGYTNALNYREKTIKRCKDQMLQLKKDGKTAKYTATNKYVEQVIEEKKTIARKRTEVINEYKEEKPKLDNLESLLVLSKIEVLEKEVDKGITKPEPTNPEPTKPEPTKPEPTKPEPTNPEPTKPEPTKPEPTKPEPTNPEPTKPEPTNPEPTKPEPTNPEPTKPEPTNPEPTKPEPTNPEPTNPEPTKPEPTKPEPTNPEPTNPGSLKVEPGIEYDGLLNKLADADGVTAKEKLEEITSLSKGTGLSIQETLEDIAQEKGLMPLQINDIQIDEEAYTITYGHGNYTRMYYIGDKDDNVLIRLDRENESKTRDFILDEFPESEGVIKKLDIGIIKILYANNRLDLCKTYIESIKNKEPDENLPDITYDLSEAKGYSRNETVLRRNARKNKEVATEIKGENNNLIKRVIDSVRYTAANVITNISKNLNIEDWENDVIKLKEEMRLMLPEGKKDVIEKGDKIIEDVKREKMHSAELDFDKKTKTVPKKVKTSPEVKSKIESAKENIESDKDEYEKLSFKEKMKVKVDNRRIAEKLENGEYDEKSDKSQEEVTK